MDYRTFATHIRSQFKKHGFKQSTPKLLTCDTNFFTWRFFIENERRANYANVLIGGAAPNQGCDFFAPNDAWGPITIPVTNFRPSNELWARDSSKDWPEYAIQILAYPFLPDSEESLSDIEDFCHLVATTLLGIQDADDLRRNITTAGWDPLLSPCMRKILNASTR